jgi:hypothetical protein
VNLRLDILLAILRKIYSRSSDVDSVSPESDSSARRSHDTGFYRDDPETVLDIINSFDADFELNKFIATSWISCENPIGLVISQQNFHVSI